MNPLAARVRAEAESADSERRDGRRGDSPRRKRAVFGSKPGAYGAGLQALIDERGWEDAAISRAPISTGAATPTARRARARRRTTCSRRGCARSTPWCRTRTTASTTCSTATTTTSSRAASRRRSSTCPGRAPHGLPQRPLAARNAAGSARSTRRSARVVRARVVNPKWIAGVHAPRLQGRVRDGGDGRLPVRLRRDDRCRSRPSFRRGVRRLSRRRRGARVSSSAANPRAARDERAPARGAGPRVLWRPRVQQRPRRCSHACAQGRSPIDAGESR